MNGLAGGRRGWRRTGTRPTIAAVRPSDSSQDVPAALAQTAELDPVLQDLTRAVERSPRTADAYLKRGLAYFKRRQFPLAIRDFTRAIELDPDFAEAYHNRALAFGETGEYDRSMSDFARAAR